MFHPDLSYSPAQWSNFFSAEVGASATLTGLLFVAVSINLSKIISIPHLASRVAKGLMTLVGVMFAASLCLVPGQPTSALGVELITLGAFIWVTVTMLQRASASGNPHISHLQLVGQRILTQLSAIPLVVCGASLICAQGGGLFWLLGGVIASLTSALLDAWVLLIEIHR